MFYSENIAELVYNGIQIYLVLSMILTIYISKPMINKL